MPPNLGFPLKRILVAIYLMHHHFIVTGFSVCNCIPFYDEGYYIGYIYIVLALYLNAKGGANMWVSVFIFQLDVEPSQSLCVTRALIGGYRRCILHSLCLYCLELILWLIID